MARLLISKAPLPPGPPTVLELERSGRMNIWSQASSPVQHRAGLCHSSILLLESFAQSLRALEELVNTSHYTALLLGKQRFGREVIDAIVEAALDEVRVHLCRKISGRMMVISAGDPYVHEVLHLLALHAALKLALFCRA